MLDIYKLQSPARYQSHSAQNQESFETFTTFLVSRIARISLVMQTIIVVVHIVASSPVGFNNGVCSYSHHGGLMARKGLTKMAKIKFADTTHDGNFFHKL